MHGGRTPAAALASPLSERYFVPQEESEMKMKLVALVVSLLLLATLSLAAQGPSPSARQRRLPRWTGSSAQANIPKALSPGNMKLSLSWVGDTLASRGERADDGWVAVGLGSPKMNDAVMYIGVADGGQGAAEGAERRRPSACRRGRARPRAATRCARRAGRRSWSSPSLPRRSSAAGQKQLDVIYAMGGSKILTSMHKARYAAQVSLAK